MKLAFLIVFFPFLAWSSSFTDANLAYQKGAYEQAIEAYEQHLNSFPLDANAWYNRGLAQLQIQDLPMASFCLEKAIHLHANDIKIQHALQSTYEQAGFPESWQHPLNGFEVKLVSLPSLFWLVCILVLTFVSSFLLFRWFKKRRLTFILSAISIFLLAVISILQYQKQQAWISGKGFAIVAKATEKLYTSEQGNAIVKDKPSVYGILAGKRVQVGTIGKRIEILINEQERVWLEKNDVLLLCQ